MFHVKFADIGEGIHEGVIFKIHALENESIAEGDTIMAIETDKVTADIPSPVSGTVVSVKGREGAQVYVGDTIAIIEDGQSEVRSNMETGDLLDQQSPAIHRAEGDERVGKPVVDATSEAVRETVSEAGSTSVVGEIEVSSGLISPSQEGRTVPQAPAESRKVLATPVARKMAKDLGVDIQSIKGSGPAGRVMKSDIQDAFEKTKQAHEKRAYDVPRKSVEPAQSNEEGLERVPMTTIRKTIAENMRVSRFTIPHTSVMDEVDVSELVAFRNEMKEKMAEENIKLTYLAFVIKAVASALKSHRKLNASYDEAAQEILLKEAVNVGIAVDAPHGLIVPVIRRADHMSVTELAEAIEDLSARARSKKLHMNELSGGTFTVTNYGAFGSSYGVPIIRYPEAAVLGIGAIQKKPVVKNDEVVIRSVMPLSMSFDHRIMDGGDAGRFMQTLKKLLEDPQYLLIH